MCDMCFYEELMLVVDNSQTIGIFGNYVLVYVFFVDANVLLVYFTKCYKNWKEIEFSQKLYFFTKIKIKKKIFSSEGRTEEPLLGSKQHREFPASDESRNKGDGRAWLAPEKFLVVACGLRRPYDRKSASTMGLVAEACPQAFRMFWVLGFVSLIF